MDHALHIFIVALRKESFRREMMRGNRLASLIPIPPYSLVAEALGSFTGDVTDADFNTILKLHLSDRDMKILGGLGDVSVELASKALRALEQELVIKQVQEVAFATAAGAEVKLGEIIRLVSTFQTDLREPRAKLSTALPTDVQPMLFTFCQYPHRRRQIHLYAAYPGTGKTSVSLALAKDAMTQGVEKVLYVCIGDWDEGTLGSKIRGKGLDSLWVALYDKATLYDIELEIETVKPDLTIIDSLTNITTFYASEERYYIELGLRAKALRELAAKYNTCMVVTHQLMRHSEVVSGDDLMGAKAHLLAELDLGLGIGGQLDQSEKNVSTIKLRHDPQIPTFRIDIDYDRLFVYVL